MMAIQIQPMPEGGLLIREVRDGVYQPVYACSDLDEALGFIKDKLQPVKAVDRCAVAGCSKDAVAKLVGGEPVCIDHLVPEHEPAAKERVTLSTGVSVPAIGPDIACKNPACWCEERSNP